MLSLRFFSWSFSHCIFLFYITSFIFVILNTIWGDNYPSQAPTADLYIPRPLFCTPTPHLSAFLTLHLVTSQAFQTYHVQKETSELLLQILLFSNIFILVKNIIKHASFHVRNMGVFLIPSTSPTCKHHIFSIIPQNCFSTPPAFLHTPHPRGHIFSQTTTIVS